MMRKLIKVLLWGVLAVIMPRKRSRPVATSTPVRIPIPTSSTTTLKSRWKRWAFRGTIALAAAGAGGFLIAASGVIPLKASSGHWAITRWFLNFSKERSVATHSIGIKSPDLSVEWRILKGAGHFEAGCRPCHGGPDVSQPRIAGSMLPAPPPLSKEVRDWEPEELFYIVKHGIKFTGMPAWPTTNRDDEVWAVVAFLQELPGLDEESYNRLVHGEAPARHPRASEQDLLPPDSIREIVRQTCARCHGVDGNGRGSGAFPKIAGQNREYLLAALEAYAGKERYSGIMEPIAAGLEAETMQHLAEYYSNLKRSTGEPKGREGFERGKAIAFAGIPEKGVPACADCHIPTSGPKNAMYPKLSGQYPEYIKLQLELFKAGHRGGTSYSHLMQHVAENLSPGEMEDLAAFFSQTSEMAEAQ